MITFDEFKSRIKKAVEARYPELECIIPDVKAPDGSNVAGFVVVERDKGSGTVAVMDLRTVYESCMDAVTVCLPDGVPEADLDYALAGMAVAEWEKNRGSGVDPEILEGCAGDYSKAEKRLLAFVADDTADDNPVAYRMPVGSRDVCFGMRNGTQMIIVDKNMFSRWNQAPDDVLNRALENSVKENPPMIFFTQFAAPMPFDEGLQAVKQMTGELPGLNSMFFLMTRHASWSNVSILYPGVCEKIAEQVGDFFILPGLIGVGVVPVAKVDIAELLLVYDTICKERGDVPGNMLVYRQAGGLSEIVT